MPTNFASTLGGRKVQISAAGWATGGRRRLRRGVVVASALLVLALGVVLMTANGASEVPPVPTVNLEGGSETLTPATPSRGAMGI